MEWQTIIALGIVALTAAMVVVRLARRRRADGCSGGCGCQAAKDKHARPESPPGE